MVGLKTWVVTGLLLATSCLAKGETIIYQDDFNRSASTPLHGLSPNVDNSGIAGGAKWVTRTDNGLPTGTGVRWYADGHLDGALSGNGAASLPFVPQAGNVYKLTVGLNAFTGPNTFWTGVGYSAGLATGTGAGAEFFGNSFPDQVTGRGWMLSRVAGSAPSQDFIGFPGPVDGGADWPTPVVANSGDPIVMQVVLDTTAAAWQLQWLAKKPTDAGFTSLRTAAYPSNPPDIRAVSFVANEQLNGSIDFLTLTVTPSVPEPASALLIVLGLPAMVGLATGRRKR